MNNALKASCSIEIKSTPERVWDVLTNPEKIKVYLFGTETHTDWEVGSPIRFEGNYNGHTYQDKGNVLEVGENELLRYNYWSSMSGLEDQIENYFIVTYLIEDVGNGMLRFTWDQEGFPTEERRQHTENALPMMLEQIKELAER